MHAEQRITSLQDVLLPEHRADPYAVYRALRQGAPVRWNAWDADSGNWVVTGYAEAATVLREPRFSAQRMSIDLSWLPPAGAERAAPVAQAITRQMLFLDPPDHTRLRGLVSKAFTPRAIEMMRVRVQQGVDDLLDAVGPAGRMDVIRDFAYPLPAIVIAELLGVPTGDRDQFKRWSDDFAVLLDGSTLTPASASRALASIAELMAYFQRVAEQRRHPQAGGGERDDLLQALILAEEQGDRLSEQELLTNLVLLLAAGHETTTNLIGNGLLALLRHPEQLGALRDDPSLVPDAVSELLRYDPPVQVTDRIALADIELGGQIVRAGQAATVVLGAANRDPRQFADPDRLDIRRQDARHLSFGYGIHFCLGAALARLEGQIAFTTLLARLPNLRLLEQQPSWHESVVFRGLTQLPVAFG